MTPTPVSRPEAHANAGLKTSGSRHADAGFKTSGGRYVYARAGHPESKAVAPHAKIDTAPLSLRSPKAPASSPAEETKGETPTPSPGATDGHERAKRRARVILSDMSLYHREALLKAAHAADAKAELGPLWRDALLSSRQVALPDTDYLEEELERQLSQLRKA